MRPYDYRLRSPVPSCLSQFHETDSKLLEAWPSTARGRYSGPASKFDYRGIMRSIESSALILTMISCTFCQPCYAATTDEQLQQLINLPGSTPISTVDKPTWNALMGAGQMLIGMGNFSAAEGKYALALKMIEDNGGKPAEALVVSLDRLAAAKRSQRKFSEAEPLLKRALEVAERAKLPDALFAMLSNNMGDLYSELGKYAEAQKFFERALELDRKVSGNQSRDVAAALDGLAVVFERQGKIEKANELHKQSLEIWEKIAPDSPDLGICLTNLGVLCGHQKRYSDAEKYLERALQIFEKTLGGHHPQYQESLVNLAVLYSMENKTAEAEEYFKRALASIAAEDSKNRPLLIATLKKYADLLRASGRTKEAEDLDARRKSLLR